MDKQALAALKQGEKFPYDAPRSWWTSTQGSPPPAHDWAHAAARGAISYLSKTWPTNTVLEPMRNDDASREAMVKALAQIIRTADPREGGRWMVEPDPSEPKDFTTKANLGGDHG